MLPLIKKDMRRRLAQSAPTFSGLPMHLVYEKWKQKFHGCFEGLVQCKWEGKLLQQAKSKAKTAARAAMRAVRKLNTAFPALDEPLNEADAAFPATGTALMGGEELIFAVHHAFETMEDVLEQGDHRLKDPYTKLAKAKQAVLHVHDTLMAYKPCDEPFALALDNAGAHSMTDAASHHLPIIPVIQVCFQ